MKTGYKYFIEHKELKTWVCINGSLTNDPLDIGLLSFDEDWLAQKWLKPIEEEWNSNFSNTVMYRDQGNEFTISLQNSIQAKLQKHGIDLFKDFIITEHEFPNLSSNNK